ncbi:MAG: sulfotransferase [Cyanobacteria bacterium J06598_1]
MANSPTFIIMGAMKCATTTLHEQLSEQPGVFMTSLKEPNFFSDDENYAAGIKAYWNLFDVAGPTDICGESSTHYTKLPTYPHTLTRLRRHLPHIKLVYVMRHPLDRLVSQYVHEWTQRTVSGSLSDAIKRYPRLHQYSLYSMQLRPYLEAFGPETVLPVFLERVQLNPAAELARIGRFIGYTQPTVWHEETGHRHASRDRLRKNPWRDALVHTPILRELRRRLVPKSVRTQVRGLWQMKQRPELSEGDRTWLQTRLDPDMATLGHWLELELSCQNFATAVTEHTPEWSPNAVPRLVAAE